MGLQGLYRSYLGPCGPAWRVPPSPVAQAKGTGLLPQSPGHCGEAEPRRSGWGRPGEIHAALSTLHTFLCLGGSGVYPLGKGRHWRGHTVGSGWWEVVSSSSWEPDRLASHPSSPTFPLRGLCELLQRLCLSFLISETGTATLSVRHRAAPWVPHSGAHERGLGKQEQIQRASDTTGPGPCGPASCLDDRGRLWPEDEGPWY